MATRFISAEIEAFGGLTSIYVNDTPVGNGADNKRIADVQLVQVFLRDFYIRHPDLFKKLPKTGSSSQILLDGKVGRQTVAAITEFQKFLIRAGKSAVFVDGRVSVQDGFKVAGTNHVFTIFQLNSFFFVSDQENMSFIDNLQDHPVVQPLSELVGELTRKSPPSE